MYCKKCGKEIPDDSIYCNHCGTRQWVHDLIQDGIVWPDVLQKQQSDHEDSHDYSVGRTSLQAAGSNR